MFLQLNLGGSQLPLDPMVTNMAMNYGADIVNQKKKEVEGMMEKYVSIGQLKVGVEWGSLIGVHIKIFSIILPWITLM